MWLERQRYAPGEVVRGYVEVQEQIDGRQLTAALHYAEETNDYRGAQWVPATQQLHRGCARTGQPLRLRSAAAPGRAAGVPRASAARSGGRSSASVDKRGFDKHVRLRIDVVPSDLGGVIFPAQAVGVSVFQPKAPALPPPGWHPDPWGQAAQRYWDGASWTQHTA